jgi:hypothetical protein
LVILVLKIHHKYLAGFRPVHCKRINGIQQRDKTGLIAMWGNRNEILMIHLDKLEHMFYTEATLDPPVVPLPLKCESRRLPSIVTGIRATWRVRKPAKFFRRFPKGDFR